MIIKGTHNKASGRRDWSVPIMLVLLLGMVIGYSLYRNQGVPKAQSNLLAYCSAEQIRDGKFIDGGNFFDHGNTQSNKRAMKGKFSSGLLEHNYGISYILKDPKPGVSYRASVWRRGVNLEHSYLEVKEIGGHGFHKRSNKPVEKGFDYWHKLEIVFTIPTARKYNDYEIFVSKDKGTGKVFFDEFRVEELPYVRLKDTAAFVGVPFHTRIDPKGLQKLKEVKARAVKDGLYIREEGDEVPAKVGDSGHLLEAKLRYKGDWLDHLNWRGESYRIKIKGENTWRGMKVFSVQRASVRGNLREWLYHRMLNYEDVLSPRYEFIRFIFNGAKPKVYACEEHFVKQLVEHQKRREGPILKFNENRFWEGMKRSFDIQNRLADGKNKDDAYWSSEIQAFDAKRIMKNPVLSARFREGQNLMFQYKYALRPPEQIFDLERMAKYVAVSELMRARHALTWHNQRFYYNPITDLLEPIGYDGFGNENPGEELYTLSAYRSDNFSYEPLRQLFYQKSFLRAFFSNLARISSREYVSQWLALMDEDIKQREAFIREGDKDYHYHPDEIVRHAKKIQMKIWPFDNSLQAFRTGLADDSMELQLVNYHEFPLEVFMHLEDKNGVIVYPQSAPGVPKYRVLNVPQNLKKVFFALPGTTIFKEARIKPFTPPQDRSAHLTVEASTYLPDGVSYRGNEVFMHGNVMIDTVFFVPSGKSLKIEAGTHIHFSNQGAILSHSPVFFKGRKEKPIEVETSDGAGGAIVVLQSAVPSVIEYTHFRNQNTFRFGDWELSGAVSFFESDVSIAHSSFSSNHCEDALNIVKSHFDVDSCRFEDIYGDAFDADFCGGTLRNTHFKHTGNDAIDYSMSKVSIENCTLENIGDKGISAGEHSDIMVRNISIRAAVMGVASKDLSVLQIDGIHIIDCQTGFAAYQKKPEFGPAVIRCSKDTVEGVKRLKMIEEGSVFDIKK